MANKQRSIRLPDDLWQFLEDLSPEYGSDVNDRLRTVLYKGIKRLDQEREAIRLMDEGKLNVDRFLPDESKASNE